MELQKILKNQNNLKKGEQKGVTILDFKTYYKATVIKAIAYQHRIITQSNEIKLRIQNKPVGKGRLWQSRRPLGLPCPTNTAK